MDAERKRILKLVEDGVISADEAITLLESLNKGKSTEQTKEEQVPPRNEENESQNSSQQQSQQSQFSDSNKSTGFEDFFGKNFDNKEMNKKMDEFMNEVKNDLSKFSNKLMGILNTTYTKIKEFDFEFPFGNKVEFTKTYSFNGNEVNAIDIEIPNGKVEVMRSEGNELKVEADVKAGSLDHDEDKTRASFEKDFVKLNDGKLQIKCQSKLSQVNLRVSLPDKTYDVLLLKLLNGGVSISELNAKLVKIRTYNGAIKYDTGEFQHADIQSGNGAIEIVRVKGEDVEVETVNGRIYIDGDLEEVEAESANGAVIITTHHQQARKVKAQTIAGAVELYVPKNLSINGAVSTNFGRVDVGLSDVVTRVEEDQFLVKTVHFDKILGQEPILKLIGESRTGSIIVRYTTMS